MRTRPVVSASRKIYKRQTLHRSFASFAVLELIASSGTSMTVAEIGDALQLRKSTAHRFLMVLERHSVMERVQNGRFRLSLRLCELGGSAVEQYDLRDRTRPISVAEASPARHPA